MTTVSLANLHMRPDWHSPVSMWRNTGSDESVTDKHMKTIEVAPPSGSFLFQYFTKKFTYLDSFIKNIFNTSALKRYGWFSLHHFPTPQYFFNPSKKLLPARRRDEIQLLSSFYNDNYYQRHIERTWTSKFQSFSWSLSSFSYTAVLIVFRR